jgi:hypothetical protein
MLTQSVPHPASAPVSVGRGNLTPWLAALLSMILLAGVGLLDFATGSRTSFTLLYLLPISTAKWFIGRRAALICCIGAAAIGFTVTIAGENTSLPVELWNAAMRLGVFLVFVALLTEIRRPRINEPAAAATTTTLRNFQRLVVVSAGAACILAAAGWFLQHNGLMRAARSTSTASATTPTTVPDDELVQLASLTERCLRQSRPVLLGSRDPQGPSCVSIVRTGEIRDNKPPPNVGDLNGGPGTTMVALYCFNRQGSTSPLRDFEWHQTRLRTYLENLSAANQPAELLAHQWAVRTREFAETIEAWMEVPPSMSSPSPQRTIAADTWPGYCLASLNRALAAKDLPAAKRWAHELAAAALSLDDLHHWLELLADNHLRALDFQRDCRTLFENAEAQVTTYDPNATISMFPAGILSLNGWGNYYEVERQAEGLFAAPPDLSTQPALSQNITAASIWIPPSLRASFVKLEESLAGTSKTSWEDSARAPYEHSYLVGMLYRASRIGALDDVATVLKKFDAAHPSATMGELLGVLMYRGHSFAGLEWADRFQPELLKAAEEIPASLSDADALLAAADWTNKFYHGPTAAYGMTFTLRDALEQKKLDCVRATDMIGAIFRNSGRPRFGHVRWCAETNAHSVAAYLGRDHDKPRTLLVDGLQASPQPETWPDAYFHGHAWPPGLTPTPVPYAVELYVRGLDSYLWAEGYIVRGPNAGYLTTARIPYSTHRLEQSTKKVFDGPYPEP